MSDVTNNYGVGNYSAVDNSDSSSNSDFNNKVLSYIKNHKSINSLNQLLPEIKGLSHNGQLSMQTITNALLYADETLRNECNDSTIDSTARLVDKLTLQLLSVNMLVNNMTNKFISFQNEDDTDFL